MERQVLIQNAINKIRLLPDTKIMEVNDFADFLLSRIDYEIIRDGIRKLNSESATYNFLQEEEDLYSVNDLKERYK